MKSIAEAKSIVEKNFKGAKAQAVYKYGKDFYLFVAPSGEKTQMIRFTSFRLQMASIDS